MTGRATLEDLPAIMVEPIVRAALLEDLGRAGDVTSAAVVPAHARATATLVARDPGVLAGIATAEMAFRLMDPAVTLTRLLNDGSPVAPGDVIAQMQGNARALLSAERTALNLLCRLSGVASATASLVAAIGNHKAKVVCTRKTTPGLRALEKHAVRAGGGVNHRFGLDDAILIKDNHIAVAGGVAAAIAGARAAAGHLVKIEVEVDTLSQLDEVMDLRVDAVLLDNMDPATLACAVAKVAGRAVTEASGRINATTIVAVAASGVDLISVGWITHSAPILDIGLDIGFD